MNIAVASVNVDLPSNVFNALEAVSAMQPNDRAYVLDTNRYYRWDSSSLATPDGVNVIIPFSQNPALVGRWFLEGAPGPSNIPPGFKPFLTTSAVGIPILERSATLTGGSPTEVVTLSDGSSHNPADPLFRPNNSICIANIASVDPNVQIRGNIPSNNVATALVVNVAGVNLPPGIVVRGFVVRHVINS